MSSKKGYSVNYMNRDKKYLYFEVVNRDTNVGTPIKFERVLSKEDIKRAYYGS